MNQKELTEIIANQIHGGDAEFAEAVWRMLAPYGILRIKLSDVINNDMAIEEKQMALLNHILERGGAQGSTDTVE